MTAVTQEQVDQAVSLLLRHVHGAPSVHFGDTRDRSDSIRRSVHRLDEAELRRRYQIYLALGRLEIMNVLPRGQKRDLYDVGHELRAEITDREKGK